MASFHQFALPCYQQGDNDCGYYCLRIAAEITLKRKMTSDEAKVFRKFKGLCAQVGSQLELSTSRFSSFFPDIGVYFNRYEAYVEEPGEYISPDTIKSILDQGKMVVVNIQNMDFRRNTLVRCKGGGGHNICCMGYDTRNFIFQDSNRYSNSCTKTMSIQTLQKGYEAILTAGEDLEKRLKAMKTATHVTEMFVADTEEKIIVSRRRRSSRQRSSKR